MILQGGLSVVLGILLQANFLREIIEVLSHILMLYTSNGNGIFCLFPSTFTCQSLLGFG